MPARARDLPDTLALPLRSGEEWWYWLGGRPALDLVNTLRERWRRRVETLVTPADLGLWLERAGLPLGDGAPPVTPQLPAGPAAPRARRHRARRGAHARAPGGARAGAHLRLGHVQRALLRSLARRPAAMVL